MGHLPTSHGLHWFMKEGLTITCHDDREKRRLN